MVSPLSLLLVYLCPCRLPTNKRLNDFANQTLAVG